MPKATGVSAALVETIDDTRESAGAFCYTRHQGRQDVGIVHSCPCGCGIISAINLIEHAGRNGPLWQNSGSREKPTLSPSVGIHAYEHDPVNPVMKVKEADGYHWHGWLRNGVWESV